MPRKFTNKKRLNNMTLSNQCDKKETKSKKILEIKIEIQQDKTYMIQEKLKKRFYLFIFRERGKEGEREGENH